MLPALLAAGTIAASMMNKPKDKLSPYLQSALNEISKVQVPDAESLKVQLQQYVQQGIITPEDAQASLVEFNAFDGLAPEATARGAQMSALQQLQDKVAAGGQTDVEKAAIQRTLDDVNNNQRGQQLGIMEDAHRRGVSGSGIELANRLMSQQNAANQAGRQGLDIAAMAEQAKMDALKSAAALGGQIESNDWTQQAQKASAQNTINQFNATNQQQVTMQNIAARNSAQMSNLAEKQRIADANTQGENQNRIRNSDLLQQTFDNRLGKAQAVAGAVTGQGNAAQKASDAKNKWTGDLVGGVNNYFSTEMANQREDRRLDKILNSQKSPYYMAQGGVVPGEAEYPGDDVRNDQVPAMLSPGELVVPRTETNEYESFLKDMPRSAGKPSPEAVKMVLQALSEMGC